MKQAHSAPLGITFFNKSKHGFPKKPARSLGRSLILTNIKGYCMPDTNAFVACLRLQGHTSMGAG